MRSESGAEGSTEKTVKDIRRVTRKRHANVVHKPLLLFGNGASSISGGLDEWVEEKNMGHVRGALHHPQTQGKIERRHQTLKNHIFLENYYLPGDLEGQIDAFVGYCNHQRYLESFKNLTSVDVYFGRGQIILLPKIAGAFRTNNNFLLYLQTENDLGLTDLMSRHCSRRLQSDCATRVILGWSIRQQYHQ